MNERKQEPIKSEKSTDGDIVETHPSFGMISVSRYTCSPAQHFSDRRLPTMPVCH